RDHAATDRRHESGPNHGGLPRPRWSDHAEEPGGAVLRESLDESPRHQLASEEIRAIGLEERPESLVRVAHLTANGDVYALATDRASEGGTELEHLGEPGMWILGGRPRDPRVHRWRDVRSLVPDGGGRVGEGVVEQHVGGGTGEGGLRGR